MSAERSTIVASGRPGLMSYVYVLRVRGGRIVDLRDYADLLRVAGATGGLEWLLRR